MRQRGTGFPPETRRSSDGANTYLLLRKRVRNVNLRVRPDGSVTVSAPRSFPADQIDRLIAARGAWIERARVRVREKALRTDGPVPLTDEQCMAAFEPWLRKYEALFAPAAGGRPVIVLKTLKSAWGICRPKKKQITLNRRLALRPPDQIEYVVLHEYLHFWHVDHGAAFHREFDRLMPDNRERSRRLSRR